MANLKPIPSARDFDLAKDTLRDLNFFLHRRAVDEGVSEVRVHHPDGAGRN
jgi:putative component of toxin-antitoxin plasmid stabilization module